MGAGKGQSRRVLTRRLTRKSRRSALKLADGRKLSVLTWEGHGAPLVLLHGFLDDATGWKGLGQATHRPCYAINLSGFDGSSCPTRNRISAYAEDVVEALGLLGLKEFTLVGHSFGGAVATAVAEKMPDQVSALALLAPAGFGRFALADFAHLPVVKNLVRLSLPLTLGNSLTASAI